MARKKTPRRSKADKRPPPRDAAQPQPEEWLPLVKQIAVRMHARLPPVVDVEELIQEGYFGLRRACRSYDATRKIGFATFATFRIRGAMIDFLRNNNVHSRLFASRQKDLLNLSVRLTQELQRPATDEELSIASGWSLAEIAELLARTQPSSLSQTVANPTSEDSRETPIGDTLPDRREEDPAVFTAKQDWFDATTRGLPFLSRLMLYLHFIAGMQMWRIAHLLALSESRVSQAISQACADLATSRCREKDELFADAAKVP